MKFFSAVSILILVRLASAAFLAAPDFNYMGPLPAANVSIQENLWAGVFIDKEPYDNVGAKIKVPTPKLPSGRHDSDAYCMTMWLGIGGTCNKMIQGGLTACNKDGKPFYRTWAGDNPGGTFELIDIKEGDEIRIEVSKISTDRGYVEVDNLTTGQKNGSNIWLGDDQLCQNKALWMVQPYSALDCAFADFGTVEFTNIYANLHQQTHNVTDATVFEIKEDNKEVTKNTYTDTTVTIEYTG